MHNGLSRRGFLVTAASLAGVSRSHAFAQQSADVGGLIVHTTSPMNAEPQLQTLVQNWITPTDQFYIRSHAPNPVIDPESYRLTVEGLVERPLSVSLSELTNDYASVNHMATLTCAGNRRSEHSKVSPVKGVPWREGAIGNARWSGVPLSAILRKAGVKQEARHVWFDGLDEIERDGGTIAFGASIPIQKAMNDSAAMPGAMVVTQMNGQPLTPDHGFPVRTVVPGYIGARSVKWLGRIVVSARPSPNHYVATAYKLVERGDPIEWAERGPIYRYVLNSVICTPQAGANLKAGAVNVQGYALAHGEPGRFVRKVEVSSDGGRTWQTARLAAEKNPYCWQLWSARVKVTATTRELIVRATDTGDKSQPASVAWNKKGYLFNAWHRVPVSV